MADNTILNSGTGGDTVRDVDNSLYTTSTPVAAKTQVVKLDFGGQTGESLSTASNPLPIAIGATPFVPSAGNTSSTQLAAGATFVGTIQANQNQPMISIDAFSDQPLLVWVQQYIDAAGTQKIPNVYPNSAPTVIPANTGLAYAFAGNGNYYQVFAQNIGTSATTKFVVDSGSGTLGAVTPLGNAPMAINEMAGVALNATIGMPVNIVNQSASITDNVTIAAQTNDAPLSEFMSGNPAGDFAGTEPLELALDDNSGVALGVRPRNANDWHQVDVNKAIILSDAPAPIVIRGLIGTVYDIDTSGYQSVDFTSDATAAGTVTVSNSRLSFTNGVIISAATTSAWTNTIAASTTYVSPVQARYTRITFTAAGTITAYLRVSPITAPWALNPYNLTQINGAAVSSASAQLGLNMVQIAGSALTTGGMPLAGVAVTDGCTLGTQITAVTPAPLVVKASAGRLYHLSVGNPNAAAVYLKVFNATSATLGTTSASMNFYIPTIQTVTIPLGDKGLFLSTGITLAVTGGASLTDNTVITTGAELNYSFI